MNHAAQSDPDNCPRCGRTLCVAPESFPAGQDASLDASETVKREKSQALAQDVADAIDEMLPLLTSVLGLTPAQRSRLLSPQTLPFPRRSWPQWFQAVKS